MKGAGYYDAHSEYQRRIVAQGNKAIIEMVDALDLAHVNDACTIADYGCGTGATSVQAIGTAVRRLRERSRGLPLHAIHADLMTNDFNQVFHNIAEGYAREAGGPIYISAFAGSFFNQIIPSSTVHLGLCSNAAHWFRIQPEVSLPEGMFFTNARGAERQQLDEAAADDWLNFLEARADEIVPNGRMLVQGISRVEKNDGSEHVSAVELLQLMWDIACGMAGDGLLEKSVLVSYVFPVYCRSEEEAVAPMLPGAPLEKAFKVVSSDTSEVANPYWEMFQRDGDAVSYARAYTEFVRAFAESTLMHHLFGPEPGDPRARCDEFFHRLEAAIANDPSRGRYHSWILRLVLARR